MAEFFKDFEHDFTNKIIIINNMKHDEKVLKVSWYIYATYCRMGRSLFLA